MLALLMVFGRVCPSHKEKRANFVTGGLELEGGGERDR